MMDRHFTHAPVCPCCTEILSDVLARQEDERRQIVNVLHNEIGQALSAIKLSAHLAGQANDPMQRTQELAGIMDMADQTVMRLRELHAQLRPPQIDSLGLAASLQGHLTHWSTRWGITPTLELAPSITATDSATALSAFRIVQDLLSPLPSLSYLHIRLYVCATGTTTVLTVDYDGALPDALTTALLQSRAHAAGLVLHLPSASQVPRLRVEWPVSGTPPAPLPTSLPANA